MDIEETRNAYERATMPDKQTMQDHLEDLMIERTQLLQQIQQWRTITIKAFNTAHGHIEGCTIAPECDCGYQDWWQLISKEKN
jgi:hypothetical protein